MIWQHNISLRPYNTFGISSTSKQFTVIKRLDEALEVIDEMGEQLLFIGGGSNLLLPEYIERPVVLNEIKGIEIIHKTTQNVLIKVMSGEHWHEVVEWALERNYGGLENLSLIPGTAGAAPIQNIGAYGVELKDVLYHVEVIDLLTGEQLCLPMEECALGYRDSIFKNAFKDCYFITSITLNLTNKDHVINDQYGAIQAILKESDIVEPTIQDISRAIVRIRQSKLPDPKVIGNCGSFFKNVEVGQDELRQLLSKYSKMPHYPLGHNRFKIPTGWILEQCGWKGKTIGAVGCYEKQALVVVNKGNANAAEVRSFVKGLQSDVLGKFNILIVPEVNIIN